MFRLSPRRLVFEAVIVGLSITAAWLLRERGLAAAGSEATRGFDPFLAATPLLIGIAVGLLTIRLYPVPVRALGWLMARRRDLVPVLGLRNLGRHPTTGYLPLLILMLTVAIGTFSSVFQVTIERSQAAVSWQEVGADLRVDAAGNTSIAANVDPTAIPGVEAASAGFVEPDALLSIGAGRRMRAYVEALDGPSYESVLAGSPISGRMPGWFDGAAPGPQAGTEADPIPAIFSTRLRNAVEALELGDVFEVLFRSRTVALRVAEFSDTFPGIPPGEPFLIVPFGPVAAFPAGGAGELLPNVVFVRGPASAAEPLLAAAGGPAAVMLRSRHDAFDVLHDAPLVAAVTGGFAVALVVAGTYAALAVVAVVVLHAQRRSREVAFLRTMGLTERQVAGLTIVEHGLPVILALVTGVTLGLGLAWLLAPGVDLAAFSDPGSTIRLQVDWVSVIGVGAAVVAVVAAAVASSSWLARRLVLGHALRIGEQ